MATEDDFTFVESEGSKPTRLFDVYDKLTSGKTHDLDVQFGTYLRTKHPELIVTTVSTYNCNLLQFARAGFAQAELDQDSEPALRMRGFHGPEHRGGSGYIAESIEFARYNYTWNNENFILYYFTPMSRQYILKEPKADETTTSNSSAVTALLAAIGAWLIKEVPAIYIYDGGWSRSTKLWEEVKKARWEDVILDPKKKKALTEVANDFFDSKEVYEEYGVPWKRGLIFHGPVGNYRRRMLCCLLPNNLQVTVKLSL